MVRNCLLRGISIMVLLVIISIISNSFLQNIDNISYSQYQRVKIENVAKNPEYYEGREISASSKIISITAINLTHEIIEIEYGLQLLCQNISNIQEGKGIAFRGQCWILSRDIIKINELHIFGNDSIIISVPGVVIFIILFFSIFKIDWKCLAFIQRRKKVA